ncbi:MAG: Glu/Leu/Phe/Val dehydrogenase, partial [Deltaproteobacteria bacterium]|nr:Glu/Leu/Phe/Val dehydrogenase [Deltaproteobacteria bacterium]
TEISLLIGPDKDLPAPDVNTNAQIMGWIMDTYSMHVGYSAPGVVTGKPLSIGGSLGRVDATGRGVVYAIISAAKTLGLDLSRCTAAVQGCGNVGSAAIRLLNEEGCKLVGVSDSAGGTYNARGLDIKALLGHNGRTGSVAGFPGGEAITNAQLLELPVDILVPAAIENQITAANAARVQARIVAEGANGPTTMEADAILDARGTMVIPDILANAGGVIVSYFEWVQNLQEFFWGEERIRGELERIMRGSFNQVVEIQQREGISMREAAYLQAIGRVVQAHQDRGLYP